MAKNVSVVEIQNSPREIPNFIKAYLQYTQNMEAPKPFHVWACMSALAGALGGKCYIDMGKFKYKPNMFIVFVAPPGVISKSTTAGVATKMLEANPNIRFGPGSCTWQALFDAFIDAEQAVMVGKVKEQQNNLNLSISELGTFLNFDDTEMVDTIVDIWDSSDRPIRRRTVGGGEKEIKKAWLNLIGCTTPSWIQKNVPEYAIGGGFVSRTIFVYGREKSQLIPYPQFQMESEKEKKQQAMLTRELIRISKLNGEFKLSDDAVEWGTKWYIKHNTNPAPHLKKLDGYAARKQAHMHKIAMCLSAATSNDMIITSEHLKTAEQMLTLCEKDMMQVFDVVSDDKGVHALQMIIRLLKENGKMPLDQIRYTLAGKLNNYLFENAVEHGLAANMITKVIDDSTLTNYDLSRKMKKELKELSGKKDTDLIRKLMYEDSDVQCSEEVPETVESSD